MDITQLILDDHYEQRRLFAILEQVSRSDTEVLAALWERLASFLELHAAAEEAIFYPELPNGTFSRARRCGAGCPAYGRPILGAQAELDELLSQARQPGSPGRGYQAVPGAGTTDGTMASIRCGPGSA